MLWNQKLNVCLLAWIPYLIYILHSMLHPLTHHQPQHSPALLQKSSVILLSRQLWEDSSLPHFCGDTEKEACANGNVLFHSPRPPVWMNQTLDTTNSKRVKTYFLRVISIKKTEKHLPSLSSLGNKIRALRYISTLVRGVSVTSALLMKRRKRKPDFKSRC